MAPFPYLALSLPNISNDVVEEIKSFSFATPVVPNFLPNFSGVGCAEEVSLIKRGPKTEEGF